MMDQMPGHLRITQKVCICRCSGWYLGTMVKKDWPESKVPWVAAAAGQVAGRRGRGASRCPGSSGQVEVFQD